MSINHARRKGDLEDNQPYRHKHASWTELGQVLALALPTCAVDTVAFLASLVGLAQVGALGTLELSALTLGGTLINLTGVSWVGGLTGGLDTLCGQMYGSGMYAAVGVLFQRAVLVCLLMGAPVYLLWWQAERLLVLMGQQAEVSRLAAAYVHRAAPCLALSTLKFCCRSYFSSQGVVLPISFTTFVCAFLTPAYNYILIIRLRWGLAGAAWAYVASEATAVALLAAAMAGHTRWVQRPERRTWAGWDRAAWRGWWPYLQVALPSTAMSCLDWWVLEVMVLLAGLGQAPDVQVSAMGLCYNAFTLAYAAVSGFGEAASTRVSNWLGAGRGKDAKRSAAVAAAAGLSVCVTVCAGLLAAGPAATRVFTDSQAVRDALVAALPLVTLAALGYNANTVLSGVFRGAGRQGLGLAINFVTLWLVGLPVAAGLSLRAGWGNFGLWAGIALMNVLQGGVMGFEVWRFNWEHEVLRSRSSLSLHASTLGDSDDGDCTVGSPAELGALLEDEAWSDDVVESGSCREAALGGASSAGGSPPTSPFTPQSHGGGLFRSVSSGVLAVLGRGRALIGRRARRDRAD